MNGSVWQRNQEDQGQRKPPGSWSAPGGSERATTPHCGHTEKSGSPWSGRLPSPWHSAPPTGSCLQVLGPTTSGGPRLPSYHLNSNRKPLCTPGYMRKTPIYSQVLAQGLVPPTVHAGEPGPGELASGHMLLRKGLGPCCPCCVFPHFLGVGVCDMAQGHRLSHSLLAVSSTQKSELAEAQPLLRV